MVALWWVALCVAVGLALGDHYATLGVSRDASKDAIKSAYRKLILQNHPDKNQDNQEAAMEKTVELNAAYEILSDEKKKAEYDDSLRQNTWSFRAGGGGGGGGGGHYQRQHYHQQHHTNFNFRSSISSATKDLSWSNFDSLMNSVSGAPFWLVQIYSERWHACWHFAPLWEKLHLRLKDSVPLGRINVDVEQFLAYSRFEGLITTVPLVLARYRDGSTIVHSGSLSSEGIMQFVEDAFALVDVPGMPETRERALIDEIDSVSALESMLTGWGHVRAKVLLVSDQATPGVLFRHMAYTHFHTHLFGFVPGSAAAVAAALGVKSTPSIVIIREGSRHRIVPLRGVPNVREVLQRELERNAWLYVPRVAKSNFNQHCSKDRGLPAAIIVSTDAEHESAFDPHAPSANPNNPADPGLGPRGKDGSDSAAASSLFVLLAKLSASFHLSRASLRCTVWVDAKEQERMLNAFAGGRPDGTALLMLDERSSAYMWLRPDDVVKHLGIGSSGAWPASEDIWVNAIAKAVAGGKWIGISARTLQGLPWAEEGPILGQPFSLVMRIRMYLHSFSWLNAWIGQSLPTILLMGMIFFLTWCVTRDSSSDRRRSAAARAAGGVGAGDGSSVECIPVRRLDLEAVSDIIYGTRAGVHTSVLFLVPPGDEQNAKTIVNACLREISKRLVHDRPAVPPFALYHGTSVGEPRVNPEVFALLGIPFIQNPPFRLIAVRYASNEQLDEYFRADFPDNVPFSEDNVLAFLGAVYENTIRWKRTKKASASH